MKKVLLFLLLAAAVGIPAYLYAQSQINGYRDAAFRADSIAAAADTARLLALASVGDSVTVYQRRIVQVELERDALDRELELRPVIEIPGELRVDTLHVVDTVQAEVSENDSIQRYFFTGEDHPFAFEGNANIDIFRRTGNFSVNVFPLTPIEINTRVSCGSEDGVRSAHVTMMADDPFSAVPGRVQASPDVCNPFKPPVFSFSTGKAVWAGFGFLAGVGVAHFLDDGFRKARYD